MSRSRHHPKHGAVPYGFASTGAYKQRACGYEYWTARPGGRNPGKQTKVRTHRLERRAAKKEENPDVI